MVVVVNPFVTWWQRRPLPLHPSATSPQLPFSCCCMIQLHMSPIVDEWPVEGCKRADLGGAALSDVYCGTVGDETYKECRRLSLDRAGGYTIYVAWRGIEDELDSVERVRGGGEESGGGMGRMVRGWSSQNTKVSRKAAAGFARLLPSASSNPCIVWNVRSAYDDLPSLLQSYLTSLRLFTDCTHRGILEGRTRCNLSLMTATPSPKRNGIPPNVMTYSRPAAELQPHVPRHTYPGTSLSLQASSSMATLIDGYTPVSTSSDYRDYCTYFVKTPLTLVADRLSVTKHSVPSHPFIQSPRRPRASHLSSRIRDSLLLAPRPNLTACSRPPQR